MRMHSYTFDLPFNVDAAFPLFTPKGEEHWVPDWHPDYIDPPSGETQPDMIFRTGNGDETTIWSCLIYDPALHHARYLRVTPTSRVAFVDVRCHALDSGTQVSVQYRFVPLSPEGVAYVEKMDHPAFEAMIGGWRDLILRRSCMLRDESCIAD